MTFAYKFVNQVIPDTFAPSFDVGESILGRSAGVSAAGGVQNRDFRASEWRARCHAARSLCRAERTEWWGRAAPNFG